MTYRVTGTGPEGPLEYAKEELAEAAYLARKMTDNGVEDVRVFDDNGRDVNITDAPLPAGWRDGSFKKSDFGQ